MEKITQKRKRKKIMAFGTFDGLHRGHLDFFKQARELSPLPILIVSVARDVNVKKIKGAKPFLSEKKRMALVKQCPLVDKVVLSGIANHIPHIIKERPEIIALGYDQTVYVKNLKKDLKQKGMIVRIARLKPYQEKVYKNKLLHR